MRTRSASAVVAVVAESPEKKRLTLRKRRVEALEEEGDIIDAVAMEEESALLRGAAVKLKGTRKSKRPPFPIYRFDLLFGCACQHVVHGVLRISTLC
jgi:hypothetical protein